MLHLHLSECESTQDRAFELIEQGHENVLVSCEKQKAGVGRRNRRWFAARESLAISFNLRPASPATLTALELGALALIFIKETFQQELALKWPNDLYLKNGKKCGGILIQGKGQTFVAGIGINLYHPPPDVPADLANKLGSVLDVPLNMDNKELSLSLYNFIFDNRMSAQTVRKIWAQSCLHMDKEIAAIEEGNTVKGRFVGIGASGQALLETQEGVVEIYNATIELNP